MKKLLFCFGFVTGLGLLAYALSQLLGGLPALLFFGLVWGLGYARRRLTRKGKERADRQAVAVDSGGR